MSMILLKSEVLKEKLTEWKFKTCKERANEPYFLIRRVVPGKGLQWITGSSEGPEFEAALVKVWPGLRFGGDPYTPSEFRQVILCSSFLDGLSM